jgi:hypothetical protein
MESWGKEAQTPRFNPQSWIANTGNGPLTIRRLLRLARLRAKEEILAA